MVEIESWKGDRILKINYTVFEEEERNAWYHYNAAVLLLFIELRILRSSGSHVISVT